MPRFALLAAAALALAAAAAVAASPRFTPSPAPSRPRRVATAAGAAAASPDTLEQLGRLVRRLGLNAGLRRGCYVVDVDPTAPPVTADVREVHDLRCGGDPQTAPRITTLRWVPATGAVITDYWGLAEGRQDTVPAGRRSPPRRKTVDTNRYHPR